MKSSPSTTSALLLLLGCLVAASEAATFTCNATTTATCQSIINYVSTNASTYANITSLFQIPVSSILAANNLNLTTSINPTIPAGSTVRIPIPCRCTSGIGQSDHTPIYTVEPNDGLDAIARYKFDLFINYTEIANANNITDPNRIIVGQKLWIPLPCSCDPVDEEKVVHLAYLVESGNTVSSIAEKFGTTESTLLKLNGMTDAKLLQAEQILDVPLTACKSSINSTSADYGLLLPSDASAYTANGCVKCSCSSSSYVLDCALASNGNSSCPVSTCSGNLTLGATSGSGCTATTCSYSGYTNTSSFKILTTAVRNQSTSCTSAATRRTGQIASAWLSLLVILISICFL